MKQSCIDFLMEQFGDRDVVDEIYGEFAASFPKLVEEAAQQARDADWEKLDRTAHAIKGNSMVVGFGEAADAAIALRRAAKLSDAAESARLIGELERLKGDL